MVKKQEQNNFFRFTPALLLFAFCGGVCGAAAAVILFVFLNSNPATVPSYSKPSYSNNDYRSVPAELIAYHETNAFYCNSAHILQETAAFTASRSGTSFIADKESKKIFVFSIDGKRLPDIPLNSVPLALAVGVNADESDELLYAVFQNRFDVYSVRNAAILSSFPLKEADNITSLAVSDTAVFTVNRNGIIYRYNKETGTLEKTFGGLAKDKTKSTGSGETNAEKAENFTGFVIYRSPITLAVSPKTGLLYAANPGKHRIEAFTPDAHWESSLSWGFFSATIDGFSGCCNPTSIAVLGDGRIVTAEKAIQRIKIYKQDGTLDSVVAAPNILETKPENVPEIRELPQRTAEQNRDEPPLFAACGENRILVFDTVLKTLRVFERTR